MKPHKATETAAWADVTWLSGEKNETSCSILGSLQSGLEGLENSSSIEAVAERVGTSEAMPTFYFNIMTADEVIEDREGTDLPDLQAARIEAIEDARLLMSHSILLGNDVSGWSVQIIDDQSEVVLLLPFTEAFRNRQ
jgi:hypothetical protein